MITGEMEKWDVDVEDLVIQSVTGGRGTPEGWTKGEKHPIDEEPVVKLPPQAASPYSAPGGSVTKALEDKDAE